MRGTYLQNNFGSYLSEFCLRDRIVQVASVKVCKNLQALLIFTVVYKPTNRECKDIYMNT